MAEDKHAFVNDVVEALIKHGDGRYDWLMDRPIVYDKDGGIEWVEHRRVRYNVTGDSLTSLMSVIRHIVG